MAMSRKMISLGVMSIGQLLEMFWRNLSLMKERCLRSVQELLKLSREWDLERS